MNGTRPQAVDPPLVATYRVDPARSTIAFTTRHLFGLGVVHGSFAVQDGEIRIGNPVVDSATHARIRAASFETGNRRRDTAVRSARFLDPETHPYISFTSDWVEPVDGRWMVHGLLSVGGRPARSPSASRQHAPTGPSFGCERTRGSTATTSASQRRGGWPPATSTWSSTSSPSDPDGQDDR